MKTSIHKRGSGILLHISSLPSDYGIGDLGSKAYDFVDFLKAARQSFWQILPINPTVSIYGNSPYSSSSAFAGNILFISPEGLVEEGWLEKGDLQTKPQFPADKVDYDAVKAYKQKLFSLAYQRFKSQRNKIREFERFCSEQSSWLEDFAQFVVFKKYFSDQLWSRWPEEIKNRKTNALQKLKVQLSDQMEEAKFYQFIFYSQWHRLKKYASQYGINIIGDIPIYVNYDSADVWSHSGIFKLDEDKGLIYVAGVPPDYFSQTGQRWGNPVYDWDQLKKERYAWWLHRIEHNLKLFDVVRIDHFRGFVDYWEIPAQEQTAVNGDWVKVSYDDFFTTLLKKFGSLPIIAEDLGIITAEVSEAMNTYEFPGMKVLLFAFGGDLKTHPYIPDNYIKNCVAYTGTHDNNTVRGWIEHEATDREKGNLWEYLGGEVPREELPWELIGLLMKSVANTVIIPMQDVLGLGQQDRMNLPGTPSGNWRWRLLPAAITSSLSKKVSQLTELSKR